MCDNAMKLYFSTRPQPSSRAVKAQKILPWEAIHPDLQLYEGADELYRSEYVSSLKTFRPTQVGPSRASPRHRARGPSWREDVQPIVFVCRSLDDP